MDAGETVSGDASSNDVIIVVSPQDASSADTSNEADANLDATASSDSAPHDASGNDATIKDGAPNADSNSGIEDASLEAATSDAGAISPEAGEAAPGEAGTGADAAIGVTLRGRAVAAGIGSIFAATSTPLAFRAVGVRDATGAIFTTNTDSTGAFQIAGVTPPYDAVVYAGDPTGWPYVYMQLSTTQPQLSGAIALVQRSATLNASVQLADCGATTCQCAVTWWYPASSDYSLWSCSGGSTSGPFNLNDQAMWTGQASATVNLHIMEWDPQLTHFWHASAMDVALTEGQTVAVGQLALTALPTAGTVTATLATPGTPATWNPQAGLVYNYPGGGFIGLSSGAPPFLSGVPSMAGATMSINANISDPSSTGLWAAESFASAPSIPTSTTSVSLTVQPPVAITAPTLNSLFSLTGTMAWSSPEPSQVYAATLVSYVNGDAGPVIGSPAVTVFTSDSSVPLGRLAQLSVSIAPQPMWLRFIASGSVASLNAMEDQQTLAQPSGSSGSWVFVPFTLTP
ncbi:MAG TPA: hypothetical protein VGL81_02850 [Polyangiaceae bacterium]